MTKNDDIEQLIADQAVVMRDALNRARLLGRREALDIITAKLSGGIFGLRLTPDGENEILGLAPSQNDTAAATLGNAVAQDASTSYRVVPGTVRPTIIAALSPSQGRRPSEITAITNLKENTVRGTIRTLGLEGIAIKRGDLWFLTEKNDFSSPKGGTEDLGSSVRS